MIAGVIGLPGFLFDDETFGVTGLSRNFPVDVIFPVAPPREPMFPVSKFFSSDISRQRPAVALLKLCQDIVGALGRTLYDARDCDRGTMLADRRSGDRLLGHGRIGGMRSEISDGRTERTSRQQTEEKKEPDRPETLHHATVWMSSRVNKKDSATGKP